MTIQQLPNSYDILLAEEGVGMAYHLDQGDADDRCFQRNRRYEQCYNLKAIFCSRVAEDGGICNSRFNW